MDTIKVCDSKTTGYQKLSDSELIIFVGMTGVGKTTTVSNLIKQIPMGIMPNRRKLTDIFIIPAMLKQSGKPQSPVTDRAERFNLTRMFREKYEGGMAFVLDNLYIPKQKSAVIFDGLRGVNEVQYALRHLPLAAFIFLEAPEKVRINRLSNRNDSFDKISADDGQNDLLAKAKAIVKKEKSQYDPEATRQYLLTHGAARTLVIDTYKNNPAQVLEKIVQYL